MSHHPDGAQQRPSLHPAIATYLAHDHLEGSALLDLRDNDTCEVHVLGQVSPRQALTGRRADAACTGLALIVPGTVSFGNHPTLAPGTDVLAVQIVGADGSLTSAVSWEGEQLVDHDPSPSCLLDLLARMQGLPTSPCGTPASWYWAAVWIAELLEIDRAACGPLEALSWHPAIDPREVTSLSPSELEAFLVVRHKEHAHAADWGALRASACNGWLEAG